jgi:hypothetical protein
MRINHRFEYLLHGASLRATLAATNAAIKILMESLPLAEAKQFYCSRADERKLLDRLVGEMELSSGRRTDHFGNRERAFLIRTLELALTATTREAVSFNPNRAKRRLNNLRRVTVGLI